MLCYCSLPATKTIAEPHLAVGLSLPTRLWALCRRAKSPLGRWPERPRRRALTRAICRRPPLTRPVRCWSCLAGRVKTFPTTRALLLPSLCRRPSTCGSGIPRPANGPIAILLGPSRASRTRARVQAWYSTRTAASSSSSAGVGLPATPTSKAPATTPTTTTRIPGNGIPLPATSLTAPARVSHLPSAASTAWCSRNRRATCCSSGAG